MELAELETKSVEELQDIAKTLEIQDFDSLRKQDLTFKILQTQTEQSGLIFGQGVLEILPDGWGFLRHDNFNPAPNDIYVSQSQIKRFGLKTGDWVSGQVRPPKENEKYYGLLRVEAVNGMDPDRAQKPDAPLKNVYSTSVTAPAPSSATLPCFLPVLMASELRNVPVVNTQKDLKLVGTVARAEALGLLSEAISPRSTPGS